MISFQKMTPSLRQQYQAYRGTEERGCEYSFVNLNIWGRQKVAFGCDFLLILSQYDRFSVYPYPLGQGDVNCALQNLLADARERGIPFRLSGMSQEQCAALEQMFPGRFHFHMDRDHFDYVYRIEDLSGLRGKRYQSKRNFANRFRNTYPHCRRELLCKENLPALQQMLTEWFRQRAEVDPLADFKLEQIALDRALRQWQALGLEGLLLMDGDKCIAMTMGSFLSDDTFDVHFEKALEGYDGAYAAINQSFALYLQEKYPQLRFLNREDDMGIPGLRKAKLSYHPDHMVEKYWARLWEDDDEI